MGSQHLTSVVQIPKPLARRKRIDWGPVVWRPQHRSLDCGQLRFCGAVLQNFEASKLDALTPT